MAKRQSNRNEGTNEHAEASAGTNEQAQAGTNEQAQASAGPSSAPSQKLTPVAKITVKTVFGVIPQKDLPPLRINLSDANPEGDANPNPEFALCRVAGYVSGVKRGESSYGGWAALVGEFVATNRATGEIFGSKTAIIPGPMGEALISSTEKALMDDADSKVRFSVDISVRRSARDPGRKYEYIVRPVIDAKLSSPALELLGLEE